MVKIGSTTLALLGALAGPALAGLALAGLALASPALADGMPAEVGPGPHAIARPARVAVPSWRPHRVRHAGAPPHGAYRGPLPGAAVAAGAAGPMLVEYREAYIGRGLVYNTPPSLDWAAAPVVRRGRGPVLHALY